MRIFAGVLLAFLLGASAHADAIPEEGLKQFAQNYADAVKARDIHKIEAFFLPALLKASSSTDKAALDRWDASFKAGILAESDPVWVRVKAFDANPQVMAWGTWKAKPEYQIEIQSHHHANAGEEGGASLNEAVCVQAGHFYIVRPFPK